jgi:hypothetical protein
MLEKHSPAETSDLQPSKTQTTVNVQCALLQMKRSVEGSYTPRCCFADKSRAHHTLKLRGLPRS